MVDSIISTSTWAHNCGMHVIADFMVGKIQQENYQQVFKDIPYDTLLNNFQSLYQQKDLNWATIHQASLCSSRTLSQIIWGMALRLTLQQIIKGNMTYKENLAEQYLALLNLLIEKKQEEAYEMYPILLAANKEYLMAMANQAKGFRITEDSLEAQKLQEQFHQNGFTRYCETIIASNKENNDLYHWLGINELTIICDYFEINPVVNNNYEPSKIKKGPPLHFINQSGSHWQRKNTDNDNLNIPITDFDQKLYQQYFHQGNHHFIKNAHKIGQAFFSQQSLKSDLVKTDALTAFQVMIEDFKTTSVQLKQFDCDVFIAKHKAAIFQMNESNENIVHYICTAYDNKHIQPLVKALVQAKVQINLINNKGYTPLHCAARANNIFAIVELVRQGVFVDFITSTGLSACHIAAIYDQKRAFVALQSLGASLTLEAYPKSKDSLPFSFSKSSNIHLSPIHLAEYNQGKIYDYLIKHNLIPEPKVDYQSTAHWVLIKTENEIKRILGIESHYASQTYKELNDLESTKTYKRLAMAKTIIKPLTHIGMGHMAVAREAIKQFLLNGYPVAVESTGKVYYYFKPTFHNYTPHYISTGFDYTSSLISFGLLSPFHLMNVSDLATNPFRRLGGFMAGFALLKGAQKLGLTDHQYQAAVLFAGKELGFGLVDAYNETTPEKKEHKNLTENFINESLNQEYEIWSALLGKERGETFITHLHHVSEWKNLLYETVGEAEHAFLNSVPGFSTLKKKVEWAHDVMVNNPLTEMLSDNIVISTIQYASNSVIAVRDDFLFNLEKMSAEYIFPTSDYQKTIMHYLQKQQHIIYTQQKSEANIKLRQAEKSNNVAQIKILESQIERLERLEKLIEESHKLSNQYYEQTNKGKLTIKYQQVKNREVKAWTHLHHLEQLKNVNPNEIIEKAQQTLGENSTIEALGEYVSTVIASQGIELDKDELQHFKNSLTQESAKQLVSIFWDKQKENYLLKNERVITQNFQKISLELIDAEAEFKTVASPEESRVMDKSIDIKAKIQNYDSMIKQKNEIVYERAFVNARYANYIDQENEYDNAERELFYAEAEVENVESECLDVTAQDDCKNRFEEAIQKKARAQENFDKQKSNIEALEQKMLKGFNDEQASEFKAFSIKIKESLQLANKLNQAVFKEKLAEQRYQNKCNAQLETSLVLNFQENQLKSIHRFNMSKYDMANLINQAYNTATMKVNLKVIVDYFVEKGVSDREHLESHFGDTMAHSTDGRRRAFKKRHAEKRLADCVNVLTNVYFPNKIKMLNDSILQLKDKSQNLNKELDFIQKNQQEIKNQVIYAKEHYFEKLTNEEQSTINTTLESYSTEREKMASDAQASRDKFKYIFENQGKIPLIMTHPAVVLDKMIATAFAQHSTQEALATHIAGEIIKFDESIHLGNPNYDEIKLDRNVLIHVISTYHLNNFTKNKDRAADRVYKYAYAVLTDTPMPKHVSRATKIVNSITNELRSKITPGLQINLNSKGQFNLDFAVNTMPLNTIYSNNPTVSGIDAARAEMHRNIDLQEQENAARNQHLDDISARNVEHQMKSDIPTASESTLPEANPPLPEAFPGPLRANFWPENSQTSESQPLHYLSAIFNENKMYLPLAYQKKSVAPLLEAKPEAPHTPVVTAIPPKMPEANTPQHVEHTQPNHSLTAPLPKQNEIRVAEQNLQLYQQKVNDYLTVCAGNDAVKRNACINNIYNQLKDVNPYLWWPGAAVMGSEKVGQNINTAQLLNNHLLGLHPDARELADKLPFGNALIAKDIVPLLLVYKNEGYAGIQKLENKISEDYPGSFDQLLTAFKNQVEMDKKVLEIANAMKKHRNDPAVMIEVFSHSNNVKLAFSIAVNMVFHEQKIVQKMYTPELVSALSRPYNNAAGAIAHLGGVDINGKYFRMSDYVKDFANFDQRMSYFKAIFSEVAKMHADPIKMIEYYKQINRKLYLSNQRAAPYEPTARESISHWERQENAKFDKKIKEQTQAFIHNLIIPEVKNKNKNKSVNF